MQRNAVYATFKSRFLLATPRLFRLSFPETIKVTDHLIDILKRVAHPYSRRRLAWTLLLRGQALAQPGKASEALREFRTLIEDFAFIEDIDIQLYSAEAMVSTGLLMRDFDKESALHWFNEVSRRFDKSEDPDMEVRVVQYGAPGGDANGQGDT